ncbi:MAG: protein kinase [Vicinamibacterales bacterium]
MIGKTIGNYRIVETLGRGVTGTVFRALDETLGRNVAVRVLHADVADSDVMKRFQLEVKALAQLNDPDIATIHDVQVTGEGVLLVTELVSGESLEALMARVGPETPERAALLVAQILSVLGHAHAVGVVHRDLKPSNVIVTERGTIKLLDFAMAPVEGASQMTAAAFSVGMPAYMAPERILGNDVDARADIYSVGALLYVLLTGEVPFDAPSATEMVHKQLNELPTPVRRHRPDLPPWCEPVVVRALAKSPVDRYQSVEEFRAAVLSGVSSATDKTGASGSNREAISGEGPTLAMPIAAVSGEEPTAPLDVPAPEEPSMSTFNPDEATLVAAVPRSVPVDVPMAGSRLVEVLSDVGPTLQMPSVTIPDVGPAGVPTMLAPTASAPTVAVPRESLAPTVTAPVAPAPTGTTLVMERKQFAAAGAILGVLVLGVVVLAVMVLRRPTAVTESTNGAASVAPPAVATLAGALPAQESVAPTTISGGAAKAIGVPPSPPVGIADPPIRTSPADPTVPTTANRAAKATPRAVVPAVAAPPPPNSSLARISNTSPFKFEAKAVVADGDKYRERDARVLLADGSVSVIQTDGKPLYQVSVSDLTNLTYSNSRQPLWNSPSGPAEAMRVEGGGFLGRGRRNWLGLRTPAALLVVRVDDVASGRVSAALQERTGLTVARLIEPKE